MTETPGATYVYHSGVRTPLNLHPVHPVLMRCVSRSPPGPSTDPRTTRRLQVSSSFSSDAPSPSPIAPYQRPASVKEDEKAKEETGRVSQAPAILSNAGDAASSGAASSAAPCTAPPLTKSATLQVEERPFSSQLRSQSSGRNGISPSTDQVEVYTNSTAESGGAQQQQQQQQRRREGAGDEEEPRRASSSIRILRVTHHSYVESKTPTKDDEVLWAHKEKEQGGSVASLAPDAATAWHHASQRQLFNEPDSFSTTCSYSSPLQTAMAAEPAHLAASLEGPKEQTGGEQKKLLARKWMTATSGVLHKADNNSNSSGNCSNAAITPTAAAAAASIASSAHASCTPIQDKYDRADTSASTHATRAASEPPVSVTVRGPVLNSEEEGVVPVEKRTPVMAPVHAAPFDDSIARFTGFPSPVKLSPIPTKAYATCASTPKSVSSEDRVPPGSVRRDLVEEARLASYPTAELKGAVETSSMLAEGSLQTAAPSVRQSSTLVFSQTQGGAASMNATAPYPNESSTANQTRNLNIAASENKSRLSISAVSTPEDTVVLQQNDEPFVVVSEEGRALPGPLPSVPRPPTAVALLDPSLPHRVVGMEELPHRPATATSKAGTVFSTVDAFDSGHVEDQTLKDQTLPPSAAGLDTSLVNTPALSSIHTPYPEAIVPITAITTTTTTTSTLEASAAPRRKRSSSDGSLQSFEICIKGIAPPPAKAQRSYEVSGSLPRSEFLGFVAAPDKTKRSIISPSFSDGSDRRDRNLAQSVARPSQQQQQQQHRAHHPYHTHHRSTSTASPHSCPMGPAAAAEALSRSPSSLNLEEGQRSQQPEQQRRQEQRQPPRAFGATVPPSLPLPPRTGACGKEDAHRVSAGHLSQKELDERPFAGARQEQRVGHEEVPKRSFFVQPAEPGAFASKEHTTKKDWYAAWTRNLSTKAIDSWM